MKKQKAVKKGLRQLGYSFTHEWKKEQKNSGCYDPFSASAEDCRRMVLVHKNISSLLFPVCTVAFITLAMFFISYKLDGSSTVFYGIFFGILILISISLTIWVSITEPGKTHVEIAKAWREPRKAFVKSGYAEGLGKRLVEENLSLSGMTEANLQEQHKALKKIADRLKILQAEGRPDGKEQNLKNSFVRGLRSIGCKTDLRLYF